MSPKPGSGVVRTPRRSMSPPDTSHGQSPNAGDDTDWRSSICRNGGTQLTRISSSITVSVG